MFLCSSLDNYNINNNGEVVKPIIDSTTAILIKESWRPGDMIPFMDGPDFVLQGKSIPCLRISMTS